jgi:HPt (histidine-containing phosphotransfer) domain-containing protein
MQFSPQAKERLALQRKKYLDSLSSKKERIANCWQLIQANGWNMDLLNEFRTEVHRLSGSAGSYGLITLGEAAQNLDRTLAVETEMTSLTATIGTLVEHLFVAFDQALESHSV